MIGLGVLVGFCLGGCFLGYVVGVGILGVVCVPDMVLCFLSALACLVMFLACLVMVLGIGLFAYLSMGQAMSCRVLQNFP